MVWTNELHNRFLMAIRQLGQERAGPKKIYEIMNVPGLTRKHVASHLQKYRLFLKKVAELLSLEGTSDEIILSSKLAKGLSYEVIKEIKKRIELIRQLSGSRTTTLNLSNTSPVVLQASSNASIPQVPCTQLSNPSYQWVSFQNQQDPQGNSLRLAGKSLFGSNPSNSFQRPILRGYPSVPYYPYNGGSNFSSYSGGIESYDSINAANAGLMDGNYGMNDSSTSVNKYGSLANISLGHGSLSYDNLSNVNHLRSFGTSNLHLCSSYYPTSSSNYSGIQGGFAGVDCSGVLLPAFSANNTQQENFSALPPRLGDPGNAADQSQSASNASGDSQKDRFDKELTELFFLMDSTSLIDKQPQQSSKVIAHPTESIENLPNELLIPPNENPNQLKGGHESTDSDPVGKYMVEHAVQPSNYANYNDQDFDVDLIEALFGTQPPN